MEGNPVDPIPFEKAITEARDRLAANEGLNVTAHIHGTEDEQSAELQAEYRKREERLSQLRGEADLKVWGLTIVLELKAWIAEGPDWKRPTYEDLRDRISRRNDEPSGVFLDRQEVSAVMATRWPEEFGRIESTATRDDVSHRTSKRGRPPGSGTYAKPDAPLLVEMRTLLKTGEASSLNAASLAVADRAEGGGIAESKARRLRDAYVSKWGNGE